MRWSLAFVLAACGGGGQSPPGGIDAPAIEDPDSFTAIGLPGGLDRLVIVKSLGDTCVVVHLVKPDLGFPHGLALPPEWGVEAAMARQPVAACDPRFDGPITDSFDASIISGAITFDGATIPQLVTSVDVRLEFAGAPSWCPPFDAMVTANLRVE